MTKFRVDYKVTKYFDCVAIISAESEEEAIKKVKNDYVCSYEDEIESEDTEFDVEIVSIVN
jgi:hypothetical protein